MPKILNTREYPPLKKGFSFEALGTSKGLQSLDQKFLDFIKKDYYTTYQLLIQYRKHGDAWEKNALSEFLTALAIYFSEFIIDLFSLEDNIIDFKKKLRKNGTQKKQTTKIDYQNLINTSIEQKTRQGFDYINDFLSNKETISEINYCLYCHKKNNDFCSTGFYKSKSTPNKGFRKNPLNELLHGCPLEQLISESHLLYKKGEILAALIIIMRDNPMVAATGDRICNDCMKSCIFQKQSPVNIPGIESSILKQILALPWGVEIYDLICKYNPLRFYGFVLQEYTGQNVLVVGMGPAGFTLAHYLTMNGTAVMGIDGINISALPKQLLERPVCEFESLHQKLSEREILGFGGVAEYGITSRWDKNFLNLIYLILARRKHFQVVGGVRFGGNINLDNVWALGFHHVTLSVGAGLPKALPVEGSMAKGMRQAQDFLMNLHLSRSWRISSDSDLLLRLPIIVVGGGLTAIDSATEARAYYIEQIKNIAIKYQNICNNKQQKENFDKDISVYEKEILQEFLVHASYLEAGRTPEELFKKFGEVQVLYRKAIQEAPSYRTNHLELQEALAQGVKFIEHAAPEKVILDQAGWVKELEIAPNPQQKFKKIAAKSILVATGTSPNVAYAFEHKEGLLRDKFQYMRFKLHNDYLIEENNPETSPKADDIGFFTSYEKGAHKVSFIGDIHPKFSGSVVKAMASAKRAFKDIQNHLDLHFASVAIENYTASDFFQPIIQQLSAVVIYKKYLAPHILHLKIKAPLVVKEFMLGQFLKIQIKNSEPLALIGFNANNITGTIEVLIWLTGKTSSTVANQCNIGSTINLMGPLGVRTKLPTKAQSMLIIGTTYVISYILSVGKQWLKTGKSIYAVIIGDDSQYIPYNWIEEASTKSFILKDKSGLASTLKSILDITEIDRISVIANTQLISDLQELLSTPDFESWIRAKIYASTHVPMQCMLKGVCAKCLVWQKCPETNKRTKAVFACSWQDQPLQLIDLKNLDERMQQDNLMESLNRYYSFTY